SHPLSMGLCLHVCIYLFQSVCPFLNLYFLSVSFSSHLHPSLSRLLRFLIALFLFLLSLYLPSQSLNVTILHNTHTLSVSPSHTHTHTHTHAPNATHTH